MKAARIDEYGDVSVVHIREVDTPTAAKGQVVVAVHAASLNPFDTTLRSGAMKDMIPLPFPATLGGDIAGVVTQVGPDVTGFAVGDNVYGEANVLSGGSGAFAQFAAAMSTCLAKAPAGLTFQQAASLPLVGASAVQALTEHLQLQAGQKIFIHGGAGGIGSIAIQVAKHIGATVVTTATGDGIAMVKSLGADEIIDYKAEDFAAKLQNMDAVFDTVGGDDFAKSLQVLKQGGVAVSMIAKPDTAAASARGVTAMMQYTEVTTQLLDQLRSLVEAGAVTPQVTQVFPLDRIQEAFTARESGHVRGKIVIDIAGN